VFLTVALHKLNNLQRKRRGRMGKEEEGLVRTRNKKEKGNKEETGRRRTR
jgi:hypothetical protein